MMGGDKVLNRREKFNLLIAVVTLIVAYLITLMPFPEYFTPQAKSMVAITFVAIVYWITECIPIPLTGAVIILLEAIFGVLPISKGLSYLASRVNALVFAGLVISIALSKHRLDRWLSLKIVSFVGEKTDRIILGMMLSTAFLSMWISNTAASAIMVPIAAGILGLVNAERGKSKMGKAMMIGIAYAASIGGMGTPVGTPPSSVTVGFLKDIAGIEVTFLQWMIRGVPMAIILTFIAWRVLLFLYTPEIKLIEGGREIITKELEKLGKMNNEQKRVLVLFSVAVVLWLMDSFVSLLPGWMYIASVIISILFMFPGVGVLTWKEVSQKADWGVLFLVGGGLALGSGLKATGVIELVSKGLAEILRGMSPQVVVALMALVVSFSIIVFCSVTATSSAFVPIAIGLAIELGIDPRLLGMVAGFASCFAFFLPANTPPNAIAYSQGYFKNYEMAKAGVILTFISALVLMFFANILW